MAGEYGIGQGITQGLQYVNQGMQNSESINTNRIKVQQEAAKFNMEMSKGQTVQQTAELQLQQSQLQLQELNKNLAKRDTWDVLSGYEQTKDASILNTIKSNPIMNDLLTRQGITGFTNISDISEEKLTSLGVTPELLNDPSKRIVMASTSDGSIVPMDLMTIYATTGFLPKLGEKKLAEMTLKQKEAEANISTLKYEDMTKYLDENPTATLSDYVSHMKNKETGDTAEMKNIKYQAKTLGITEEELLKQKAAQKESSGTPASVKTAQYNQGVVNTLKQESKVDNLYDVDYNKLSPNNRTRFDDLVKEDAKNIKPEERDALSTLQAASEKLNVEDLKNTTGIVDATFNKLLDTLGMDLPDEELVQSANYNLIKNSIVRASMGTQVTGNELERMTAQLGTEFKSDKTVRIKMAETLDNLVAKYEGYKSVAPAFYARVMKDKVDNMKTVSDYLRSPEKGKGSDKTTKIETTKYKVGQIVTDDTDNSKWKFLGGDMSDKKNWKKVEE